MLSPFTAVSPVEAGPEADVGSVAGAGTAGFVVGATVVGFGSGVSGVAGLDHKLNQLLQPYPD